MPELPEMEHYRDVLEPLLKGKVITQVVVERDKSINLSQEAFKNEVVDQSVLRIERRAKYLAFHLSSGQSLLLHLMLGGKLFFGTEDMCPEHSKQVSLFFGEQALFFIGLRLGYLHVVTPNELEEAWANLGPDPISPEFTEDLFFQRLKKKSGRLKAVLVDQSFIAGIGNRYSDEICFGAALHPGRTVTSLSEEDKKRLFHAIKAELEKAIEKGGYLDMPIFKGDEVTGGAEADMAVHRRAGEACPRCGHIIVEEKIASKKTSFCPNCQH